MDGPFLRHLQVLQWFWSMYCIYIYTVYIYMVTPSPRTPRAYISLDLQFSCWNIDMAIGNVNIKIMYAWSCFLATFLQQRAHRAECSWQAEAVSFHVPKLATAAPRACEAWADWGTTGGVSKKLPMLRWSTAADTSYLPHKLGSWMNLAKEGKSKDICTER